MKAENKEFSYEELKQAFDAVANPKDWKDEINALIPADRIDVTVEAIRYFTATEPTVLSTPTQTAIYSVGYRMGPAGP